MLEMDTVKEQLQQLGLTSSNSEQELAEAILQREVLSRKVFANDVVLQRLFKYFSVKDLKNIRQVCSQWRAISEPIFRKRTKVFILVKMDGALEKLNEVFHRSEFGFLPFTTLQLHCFFPDYFLKLSEFFTKGNGNVITSLTLLSFTYTDENGILLKNFDISGLIGPNLRQLSINSQMTKLSISTNSLSLVKYITILNSTLDLTGGILSPISLELNNVKFTHNGEKVETADFGEFVDCENLETLRLKYQFRASKNFILDSTCNTSPISLKFVEFLNVNILNWGTLNWKFDKGEMPPYMFDNKTSMEIKKLDLLYKDTIDLNNLPSSIENINRMFKVKESGRCINLPNLRFISLCGDLKYLRYFNRCPNLTHIELMCSSKPLEEVYTTNFPKTLKTLVMGKRIADDVCWDGEVHPLEKLVLCGEHKNSIGSILRIWNPKLLVIDNARACENDQRMTELVTEAFYKGIGKNIEGDRDKQLNKVLMIGPFQWKNQEDFKEFSSITNVRFMSRCYVFINGRGTALKFSNFYKIVADVTDI